MLSAGGVTRSAGGCIRIQGNFNPITQIKASLSLSHFISPIFLVISPKRERELQVSTNRVKARKIEGGTEKLAVDLS